VNAIRAVLFDLDGTLVDTAPDIAAAMNHALGQFQLRTLPQIEIANRIGRGPQVLVERILAVQETLDPAQREQLIVPLLGTYLRRYYTIIGRHGRLFPGVQETLRTLRAQDLRLGVVTNSLQPLAQTILERYELGAALDLLISGDRVTHRKPHPEPLEVACRTFGIATGAALMVGDSSNDVCAARAAGCDVVCVPYGYNEGQPLESLACEILENLTFLPGLISARQNRLPVSA
jgi:phosphoglycolate phosphatase